MKGYVRNILDVKLLTNKAWQWTVMQLISSDESLSDLMMIYLQALVKKQLIRWRVFLLIERANIE